MSRFVPVLLSLALVGCSATGELAVPPSSVSPSPVPAAALDDPGGGWGDALTDVALYIPNRVFDLLDIVRARVRVGPGVAVGLRATELADLFLGTYGSVWAGIHGPRGDATIPWPVGFESKSGLEASVADMTVEGGIGPDYGDTEFGISLHALLVGIDVGLDPLELVDFPLGFFGIDIEDDDL